MALPVVEGAAKADFCSTLLVDEPGLEAVGPEIAWLEEAIDGCLKVASRLYQTLPQQWVHQDLALSNVLQVDGRICGMLDFEFADRDLRALDLVAMINNSTSGFGDADGWRQAEALCLGYCRRVRLTDEEIDALPDVFRLRCVAANIHGCGRWFGGFSTTGDVVRRLRDGAACERAVRSHPGKVRDMVRSKVT